jgi:hypothetical protein
MTKATYRNKKYAVADLRLWLSPITPDFKMMCSPEQPLILSLMSGEMFHNLLSFYWKELAPRPNHKLEDNPPVICPQLLIQYICSYTTYVQAVPPSTTWGSAMP